MAGSVAPIRRLIVLGSTGSIGVNTLEVVAHLNKETAQANGGGGGRTTGGTNAGVIEVVGLAAGGRAEQLIEQAKRFGVRHVAVADSSKAALVRGALPGVTVFDGSDAARQLVQAVEATDVAAAIVGSAGLQATVEAVKKGLRVSLANKETLVAAGALVTPLVRQCGATLIPVDSEHSAIFQCMVGHAGEAGTNGACGAVDRIVLTASGGPFRTWDKAKMDSASPEEALKHPNWDMGAKITIDSATMMNKALEIIEAHWLFDLPSEKIDVIVHPQSIVHSFVEFADHSVLAQLGPPDMKTPIQYALTYPERPAGCSRRLDWSTLEKLTFERPNHDKFPSLRMGYEVIDAGGTAGAVFNAANEQAVQAFLNRRIPLGRIFDLVAEALSAIPPRPIGSLEDVMEADRQARRFVDELVSRAAATTK